MIKLWTEREALEREVEARSAKITTEPRSERYDQHSEAGRRLRDALDSLCRDPLALDFIIVDGRRIYLQFSPNDGTYDALYGETSSNAFLEGNARLTSTEIKRLQHLGWNDPNPDSPNYWNVWPAPVPLDAVVELVAETLEACSDTIEDIRLSSGAAGSE
jgi:hypothetical protein